MAFSIYLSVGWVGGKRNVVVWVWCHSCHPSVSRSTIVSACTATRVSCAADSVLAGLVYLHFHIAPGNNMYVNPPHPLLFYVTLARASGYACASLPHAQPRTHATVSEYRGYVGFLPTKTPNLAIGEGTGEIFINVACPYLLLIPCASIFAVLGVSSGYIVARVSDAHLPCFPIT